VTKQDDIPVLDDLIEKGIEITLSDLGLDDDGPPLRVEDVMAAELEIDLHDAAPLADDPFLLEPVATSPYTAYSRTVDTSTVDQLLDNPALEQAVRRILDEHMELAWQEIRLAIRQHLDRS
jgi:hypothetical protein